MRCQKSEKTGTFVPVFCFINASKHKGHSPHRSKDWFRRPLFPRSLSKHRGHDPHSSADSRHTKALLCWFLPPPFRERCPQARKALILTFCEGHRTVSSDHTAVVLLRFPKHLDTHHLFRVYQVRRKTQTFQ